MTPQEQQAFDAMRSALETLATAKLSDGTYADKDCKITLALSAAKAVQPQAQEKSYRLYECVGCGHLYMEKPSQCDCLYALPKYNNWIATPAQDKP